MFLKPVECCEHVYMMPIQTWARTEPQPGEDSKMTRGGHGMAIMPPEWCTGVHSILS